MSTDKHGWLVTPSEAGFAAFNMAVDEALLDSMLRLQKPVLRFYGWTEPAPSFG
jgi:lipoate-protein ligase A